MKQFQNKLEVIKIKYVEFIEIALRQLCMAHLPIGPCLEFGRAIFHDCTFILYYILDIYNLFYFVCVCVYILFIYLFI